MPASPREQTAWVSYRSPPKQSPPKEVQESGWGWGEGGGNILEKDPGQRAKLNPKAEIRCMSE